MQQQQMRRLAFFFGATAVITGGLFAAACGTDNGTNTEVPTPNVDSGNNATNPPKKDSGSDPSDDGGGNNPQDDGGTEPDGSSADCSKAPKLRDNTKGFRCPFIASGDAGTDGGSASWTCNNDEICCMAAKNTDNTNNPSFCVKNAKSDNSTTAGAAACKAYADSHSGEGLKWPEPTTKQGTTWECLDSAACGSGSICCLYTAAEYTKPTDVVNAGPYNYKSPAVPKSCNAQQFYKEGGTHCVKGNACPTSPTVAKTEIRLCSVNDNNCPSGTTCTPIASFQKDLGYCK